MSGAPMFPAAGILVQVATTGTAGFALQNATPTILSWTAPNDGNAHVVAPFGNVHISSAETGGVISGTFTDPGGNSGNAQLDAGGHGASTVTFNGKQIMIGPGTTFSIVQTALTIGAATVWCSIWAF